MRDTPQWKTMSASMSEQSLIGSPRTIWRKLRELEAAHIDQIIGVTQTGKTPQEWTLESMELFAREVMPEFQSRHDKHDEWKKIALEDPAAAWNDPA